ncbi:hypothetical protein ACR79T_10055 [Sphingobacterium spiritivorum]|uniref:hypothetical protein n=1 Tax=Sphingobacterium spiritivorum TaxID=258 RepID=UPI003DA3F2D7
MSITKRETVKNPGGDNCALKTKIDLDELLFMKNNWPTGFPRIVSDALLAEGITMDRIRVHNELTTIKSSYDARIIEKARKLLKEIKGLEYEPKNQSHD